MSATITPAHRAELRQRVHGITAATWNPDLHPRGRDGKWIEALGLVKLFDVKHKFPGDTKERDLSGKRAWVVDIVPDPDDPENPDVKVGFGGTEQSGPDVTVMVKPKNLEQAPEKARIDPTDFDSQTDGIGPAPESGKAERSIADRLEDPDAPDFGFNPGPAVTKFTSKDGQDITPGMTVRLPDGGTAEVLTTNDNGEVRLRTSNGQERHAWPKNLEVGGTATAPEADGESREVAVFETTDGQRWTVNEHPNGAAHLGGYPDQKWTVNRPDGRPISFARSREDADETARQWAEINSPIPTGPVTDEEYARLDAEYRDTVSNTDIDMLTDRQSEEFRRYQAARREREAAPAAPSMADRQAEALARWQAENRRYSPPLAAQTPREADAGNVHVGDEIMLPGDLQAEVLAVNPVPGTNDVMEIVTPFGTYTFRMSDRVQIIPPARRASAVLAEWVTELAQVGDPDPTRIRALESEAADLGMSLTASATRLITGPRRIPGETWEEFAVRRAVPPFPARD